jgi:hypothetical protein
MNAGYDYLPSTFFARKIKASYSQGKLYHVYRYRIVKCAVYRKGLASQLV